MYCQNRQQLFHEHTWFGSKLFINIVFHYADAYYIHCIFVSYEGIWTHPTTINMHLQRASRKILRLAKVLSQNTKRLVKVLFVSPYGFEGSILGNPRVR